MRVKPAKDEEMWTSEAVCGLDEKLLPEVCFDAGEDVEFQRDPSNNSLKML